MLKNQLFSENTKINALIGNILDELCPFLEEQASEISELTSIGKALGNGKDLSSLLEMILSISRRLTKADGGTLYMVSPDKGHLNFRVIQNHSLKTASESFPGLNGVPLYDENGKPNMANASSYVFHTGQPVNIEDIYRSRKFDFAGTRQFDTALGYRSRSMIVIPMKNHQEEIIGVLQLINSLDSGSSKPTVFSKDAEEKALSLASQAAILLTQQMLIMEMRQLFEAFVKAIAMSIDEKSKHTGGHIQRVTELSLMIAEKINQDSTCFAGIEFTPDEMDELRIAALMHDTGKITTPEHIIRKSARLETVFDRIELIETRWELFKTNLKLKTAEKKLAMQTEYRLPESTAKLDRACEKEIQQLENDLNIIRQINSEKSPLSTGKLELLRRIHTEKSHIGEKTYAHLSDDEYENLSIQKGTITQSERKQIKLHANLTEKILNQLPWPRNLSKIPFIAGAHHEKLDGTGYPLGLNEKQLNLQARILAVADIFEALSAPDRPYKKPMPLDRVEKVLRDMGKKGSLDKDIIRILFQSSAHMEYADKHLSSS